MTRRIVLFNILFVVFCAAGACAAAPDFSGNWKLNAAKSDFGKFPAPQSSVRRVTQDSAKVLIVTTQVSAKGEATTRFTYTLDGKAATNQTPTGELKGSAQWIGDKLMIESSREVQKTTLTQKDIWTLSPDRKTLTVDSHVGLPNGEFDIKQVFERE